MKSIISNIINASIFTSLIFTASYATTPGETLPQDQLIERQQEVTCLAMNIYYEARGSSFADKVSVADVVINRTLDRRYPATICEVVHQGNKDANGNMIRNQCQFSWYCDGKNDIPVNEDAWEEAMLIAWNMKEHNRYRGLTEGATHYHASYVNPSWASSLQLVGRIGEHIYYRWEK